MRLLWYGETHNIETGAAQVSKNLLPVFREYFDNIRLFPINQWWETKEIDGFTIIPSPSDGSDILNRGYIKKAMLMLDFDCLFLTCDINQITDLGDEIEVVRQAGIPIIMYAATDSNIYFPSFYRVLEKANVAVLYSFWSQRLVKRMLPDLETRVIYHGCEPEIFYPLTSEEKKQARKELFNLEEDTFLVLQVNRNQVRKDIARSMAAFHLFWLNYDNSRYYIHSKIQDMGGNLPFQASSFGINLEDKELIFSPFEMNEKVGVTRETLNKIYNCADCFITCSTGEGWGLTTTEAMCAGVPFIGPNNTVFPELMGGMEYEHEGPIYYYRNGFLVESGGKDLWATFYGFIETPRPLTSTTAMADAIDNVYIYKNTHVVKDRVKNAREWCLNHTWSHVQDQWRKVFSEYFTSNT